MIERLNVEVNKVMQTAESQKHFAALGGEVTTGTPEQGRKKFAYHARHSSAGWNPVRILIRRI